MEDFCVNPCKHVKIWWVVVKGSYIDISILIDMSFQISILILKVGISISFPAPTRKNVQNSVLVYQFPVVS